MKTYAAFYVIGYILENVAGDNIFYIMTPLTDKEKDNLERPYQVYIDDHYKSFRTTESAIKEAQKLDIKGKKFIKIMTYKTDNIEYAKKYCLIKDENGNPIELKDFKGETYFRV